VVAHRSLIPEDRFAKTTYAGAHRTGTRNVGAGAAIESPVVSEDEMTLASIVTLGRTMHMRTFGVVSSLVVILATATANAEATTEHGSAPTQPAPGTSPVAQGGMPETPVEEPGAAPAAAPMAPSDAAAPPSGAGWGTVQGPAGESMPVMAAGTVTPVAARRLVLRMGQGAAQVFVKLNMAKNEVGKPTTITPDIYYGVNDFLQLGVVHTSPLGWQTPGGSPNSLCITGTSNGCPKVYNNLGIDALALLLPGPFEIAGHLRFNFDPIDPLRVNLLVGFVSKLRLPWFAFVLYPSVQFGLNKRGEAGGPTPDGNKEMIYIPGEIVLQVTPLLALFGQAAIYSQAQHFGDHYRIPLGAAALFTVTPMLDVGVRWAWDNVGKTSPGVSRGDERSLVALANLHF
jgi:hypothetical protein